MTEKKTVALLCGGRSSEHPISLITAAGVLGAIDRTAYDVITIGITRDGRWYLTDEQQLAELTAGTRGTAEFPAGTQQVFLPMGAGDSRLTLIDEDGNVTRTAPVDVVFPLLHGPFGEDGTVQGLLEMADLHYVGCGVTASAVGMDKHFMKVAFESAGLEVGPYEVVTNRQWEHEDREQILERVLKLGFLLRYYQGGFGGGARARHRGGSPSRPEDYHRGRYRGSRNRVRCARWPPRRDAARILPRRD